MSVALVPANIVYTVATVENAMTDAITQVAKYGKDHLLVMIKAVDGLYLKTQDYAEKTRIADIRGRLVNHFANFHRKIDLDTTQITGAGLAQLAGLAQIPKLELADCKGFPDAELAHLVKLA